MAYCIVTNDKTTLDETDKFWSLKMSFNQVLQRNTL